MEQNKKMNKLIVACFLAVSYASFSQNKATDVVQSNLAQENNKTVFHTNTVDIQPGFPGGTSAFFRFVSANFHYPEEEEFNGGKMMVTFIVEEDGSLTDIKTLSGPGFGTDHEIYRVLKLSPKWNPAMKNGKKVRSNYSIPITLYGAK